MRNTLKISLFTALLAFQLLASSPALALDLNQYKGKVVVVDFWASWCVPCRRSFPWLQAMQERYKDRGLVIIGVNVDADKEQALKFLNELPVSFVIKYDPAGALAKKFDVYAMPSSFVINREGAIIKRHNGFKLARQAEYEAVLIEALDSHHQSASEETTRE